MNHQQKLNKTSGLNAARYEYLKKMNSSAYRKEVKRNMNLLKTYNRICRDSEMTASDMRGLAHYFSDNTRNPGNGYKPSGKVVEESILPTKQMKM